jgi:signal transduction histidine kinase
MSLRYRILLILVIGIMSTQALSYGVWRYHEKQLNVSIIDKVSKNIAYRMLSTVQFFTSLPREYRHIVLDQLRQMGGTRFYVSLNQERIYQDSISASDDKHIAEENFNQILSNNLANKSIFVDFVDPYRLRVHKQDTLLIDLPKKWSERLLLEPLSAPVVVVQIPLEKGEWLYLATILPVFEIRKSQQFMSYNEMLYVLILITGVLLIAFVIVQQQVQPLKALQRAALKISEDISHPPIPETGSTEMQAATSAFNRMQHKIQEDLITRENLFTAMSHDLKTPITRLRLRVEMMTEQPNQAALVNDIEHIDNLVKEALNSIKEQHQDESHSQLSLRECLAEVVSQLDYDKDLIQVNVPDLVFFSQASKLKQALSNIIENAIFYGQRCFISAHQTGDSLTISVRDQGPGIPPEQYELAFNPFTRLEHSRNRNTGGTGLGLGIARSNIRKLGGDILLDNFLQGGLIVNIHLVNALNK